MLFKKVVYVTQFVSDQDKALDFYTRARRRRVHRLLAKDTRRIRGTQPSGFRL